VKDLRHAKKLLWMWKLIPEPADDYNEAPAQFSEEKRRDQPWKKNDDHRDSFKGNNRQQRDKGSKIRDDDVMNKDLVIQEFDIFAELGLSSNTKKKKKDKEKK